MSARKLHTIIVVTVLGFWSQNLGAINVAWLHTMGDVDGYTFGSVNYMVPGECIVKVM